MTFPPESSEITHILVVKDIDISRKWYTEVLGATLHSEYGGTSLVLNFQGAWLLVVTGGEPTADKPDTTFTPPSDTNNVSHAMTIRVPDCQESYDILAERGAQFITPPHNWGYEIRCFFRDPDGHLFEISQVANLP